jgi:hypothetical protein
MYRDAIRAKGLTINGKLNNIRSLAPSCIADCGNFINVYAELRHVIFVQNYKLYAEFHTLATGYARARNPF